MNFSSHGPDLLVRRTVNTLGWPFDCPQVGTLSAWCLKRFSSSVHTLQTLSAFLPTTNTLYTNVYIHIHTYVGLTPLKQPLMTPVAHSGAFTRPRFRNAQRPSSGKICLFYIYLSNSAAEKSGGIQNHDSFLINRTAVLYSSPITGSSGPFAVTHFLQQADDETA